MNKELRRRAFIFGSGRSGTTFLAKLIDASPDVLYLHEPDKLKPSRDIPFLPEPESYPSLLKAARSYLEQIYSFRRASVMGIRPLFPKRFRSPLMASMHKTLLAVAGALERLRIPINVPLMTNSGCRVEVLKSVSSICRGPLFSKSQPDIKLVHIVRHPCAVVASVIRGVDIGVMQRGDYVASVSQLASAKSLPIDLKRLESAHYAERAAYVWLVQNDKAYQELKDSPNYLLISYEDLCVNLRQRVSEVFESLGLTVDPQVEHFVDAINTADSSQDYFSVVKNPATSITAWEKVLEPDVVHSIENMMRMSEIGQYVLDKYAKARLQLNSS